MNKVVVMQPLRLCSERLPRKPLAQVGGERLVDRGLRLLREAQDATGVPAMVTAWEGDAELVEAVTQHGLKWQPISEANSRTEQWLGMWDGWIDDLRQYDWVLFVNAACHPFLRLQTVIEMIHRAQSSVYPWCSAIAERGLVWDEHGESLLCDTGTLNTKTSPFILKPSHLASAWAVSDMREEVRIRRIRPELFTVTLLELLDIDTPSDLRLAQLVAAGLDAESKTTLH